MSEMKKGELEVELHMVCTSLYMYLMRDLVGASDDRLVEIAERLIDMSEPLGLGTVEPKSG